MDLLLLIGALAAATGFLSGMLGIGGGIIMAPLLLYLPPLCGFSPLSMHVVAGLTIVQGLASCLTGALTHRRFNFVSGKLAAWMGIPIFIFAMAGGASAGIVGNSLLLIIFAALAMLAAILLFVPTRDDCEAPELETFSFNRFKAVLVAGAVGFVGGMVGQGGSFIIIPLLTSFMQVPTRIAIGSNLAIVLLATLAAFIGKALTGQIVWEFTLAIVIGVIPAAHLGSLVSRKVPVAGLRLILGICIALAALKVAFSAAGY